MSHVILQQGLVALLVIGASGYVFWAIAGDALRLRLVNTAHRMFPPVRGPLERIRRRIESPSGCSVCRSGSK